MTKIVLNARDQNGEYYIPPVVSSSSVGDLAWLLSCLGEYPHAMWSESGFMAACEAFLSTDSAQAERSSREAAFTYLATYVADAIYEFLIDPENASGPGLETSKILMSINGEVQVIDLRGAGRLTPMMANEQPVHVLAAATVPVRSSIGLQPGAVDPDLLKAIPELSLLSVLAGGTQRQWLQPQDRTGWTWAPFLRFSRSTPPRRERRIGSARGLPRGSPWSAPGKGLGSTRSTRAWAGSRSATTGLTMTWGCRRGCS